MIVDLMHRLLSRWGPLVPRWELMEAWSVAAVFEREVEQLEGDLTFAYSLNAGLMATVAAQDVEIANLNKRVGS